MIYQKLLIGEKPYMVNLCAVNTFTEHRHPEAEFIYCVRGSLNITLEKNTYEVSQGELVLIAPMTAHEFANPSDPNRSALVIEVGPALIRSHFEALTKTVFTPPVKRLDGGSVTCSRLRALLDETVALYGERDEYTELLIVGNVYKICAYILQEFSGGEAAVSGDFRAVANIEKALALIHDRFAEPITVEEAAAVTGYGKSNFCRIFKNIVGDTFHNVLNRRRVENARCYLDETSLAIADIAPLVGFADAKTFCRVFKTVTGTSPGQYRSSRRKA